MAPTRTQLTEDGVEIEEDPDIITELPEIARQLRSLLLNFKEIIEDDKVLKS